MSLLFKIVVVVVVIGLVWTFWVKDTQTGRDIRSFFRGDTEMNPNVKMAKAQMREMAGGVQEFYINHNNRFPKDLRELLAAGKTRYRIDPWNVEYDFAISAAGVFTIRSAGPDKEFSTRDDITTDWTLDNRGELLQSDISI